MHPAQAPQPSIAILDENTLSSIGLATVIARMMPKADVRLFSSFRALEEADSTARFFHYFTTSALLLRHAAFFLPRRPRTIVLVHGDETNVSLQNFHCLNVRQDEQALVRAILRLAQTAHAAHGTPPRAVEEAIGPRRPDDVLTPREKEVVRHLVLGRINKEVADAIGVSLTTVISHRRNIMDKLSIKSLSALTIYAVMHGIVKAEEI